MNEHSLEAYESDCLDTLISDSWTDAIDHPCDQQQLEEAMLCEENAHLRKYIEVLRAKIGLKVKNADAVEIEDRSLVEQEEQLLSLASQLQTLEDRRSILLNTINDIKSRIRAVQEDERTSGILQGLLTAKLNDYTYKRKIILRKLYELKSGIRRMEIHNERIIPIGMQQDDLLRRTYLLLKETKERMELSIMFRHYATTA